MSIRNIHNFSFTKGNKSLESFDSRRFLKIFPYVTKSIALKVTKLSKKDFIKIVNASSHIGKESF